MSLELIFKKSLQKKKYFYNEKRMDSNAIQLELFFKKTSSLLKRVWDISFIPRSNCLQL